MPLSKLWAIPSDAASFKWELKFFKPGKQGSFSNKNSILEQANTHRNLLATLTFPFRTVTPQATNIAHLWKVGHADLPRWWAPAGLEKLRGRWGLCRLLATSSPEQCHWRGLELGPCGGHDLNFWMVFKVFLKLAQVTVMCLNTWEATSKDWWCTTVRWFPWRRSSNPSFL